MSLRHIHHHSWFPFVLIGLSFTLILVVIFFVVPRGNVSVFFPQNEEVNQEALSEDYELSSKQILTTLFAALDGEDEEAKIQTIDQSTNSLLALLVPSKHKDLHLEIVLSLNLLRQGSLGEETLYEEGLRRLQALVDQYSWL